MYLHKNAHVDIDSIRKADTDEYPKHCPSYKNACHTLIRVGRIKVEVAFFTFPRILHHTT
jgi:hypothetical protein